MHGKIYPEKNIDWGTEKPSADELAAWLESGALVAWGDHFLLMSELSESSPESSATLYAPDFFMENKNPWFFYKKSFFLRGEDLLGLLKTHEPLGPAKGGARLEWEEPSYEYFKSRFQKIKAEIQKGELKKLVPVVFEVSSGMPEAQDRLFMVKSVVEKNRAQNLYGVWNQKEGILGCTPEVLFEYEADGSRSFKTMALAGTYSSRDFIEGSLLNDPKERAEHDFVVQGILDCLKNWGKAQTSETYEWSVGPLVHLRTDINLYCVKPMDKKSFLNLIKELHPTPALGVVPRGLGLSGLKKYEGEVNRRRFGAPFGVQVPGRGARALVGIRNIQWCEGKTYLGSGCGIVEGSRLEKEWEELKLKRSSVKRVLGL